MRKNEDKQDNVPNARPSRYIQVATDHHFVGQSDASDGFDVCSMFKFHRIHFKLRALRARVFVWSHNYFFLSQAFVFWSIDFDGMLTQ